MQPQSFEMGLTQGCVFGGKPQGHPAVCFFQNERRGPADVGDRVDGEIHRAADSGAGKADAFAVRVVMAADNKSHQGITRPKKFARDHYALIAPISTFV